MKGKIKKNTPQKKTHPGARTSQYEMRVSALNQAADNWFEDKINVRMSKKIIGESEHLFEGLITGDENYHSRNPVFVPLWG